MVVGQSTSDGSRTAIGRSSDKKSRGFGGAAAPQLKNDTLRGLKLSGFIINQLTTLNYQISRWFQIDLKTI